MKKTIRLLIVEDNASDADLLLIELQRHGWTPEWERVEREPEYLAALERSPDVILSDLTMPRFDGLRALALLQERDLDIPFVLVSGSMGEEKAVEAIKLGAQDYLLKDRTGRLVPAIERALEERRLRADHRAAAARNRILLNALEAAAHSIIITNSRAELEWANPAFYRMTGYTAADVTGRNLRFLKSGEHPPAFYRSLWATILSGKVWEGELVNRRKDGTHYLESMTITPVRDPQDRVERFIAVKQDVTERRRIESELRKTHEKLSQLLAHSPAVLYTLAVEGERIVPRLVSDNITLLLGFSVAEALDPEWFPRNVHPDDRERVFASFKEALIRRTGTIEFRIRSKEGAWHWVVDRTRVLSGRPGEPTEVIGVWIDVTDRRQAEDQLRDSEERFRQLAENIHEVFWLTDPAKNEMLYVSPAYEPIWGRTCASLYAAPREWLEAIHPEDRERVRQAAITRQSAGSYDEIYRILRPDGTVRWIRDRAFPVRNSVGTVYRIVGTAEDITERRQAEQKLEEQATLLDKARDAIIVRDLDHRIRYWNKSAERVYGWTAEEAVGRNAVELLYHEPGAYLKVMETVLAQGEWQGELEQVNKGKKSLTIEGRWTLVRDAHGEPQSILAINTDITEKKKLEIQFLRAQRMESIGTLAGGIAHDLNNLLAPILVSVELLNDEVTSEDGSATLKTVQSCTQRGADLVRQVLTFARGMEGERIEVNVGHLLRDLRQVIRETFPKDIQAIIDPARDAWPVVGDPTQLHQVFMNLSVNARDAMPRGGRLSITVENQILDGVYSSMDPDAKCGRHLVITFTDTGTGITPEIRERIFEPFFTTKEIGKGTGLGLSTVMAIVRSHGGFINVYSEPGQGTTFKLYLPASGEAGSPESAAAGNHLPRGRGECVLLVDDEAGIRELTGRTLEQFGYRVRQAANGAEALAVYVQHRDDIAVVLTDMAMPVMDGPAAIIALKSLNPAVRIICSSGLASNEGIVKTMGAGVQHFLAKPYTAETILKTLAAALADTPVK